MPSATFTGLRTGLHLLLVGLTVLAVVRVFVVDEGDAFAVLVLAIVFLITYALGGLMLRRASAEWWLVLLTLEWFGLVWLTPEAGYLVFPLFFLYLHALSPRVGPAAVICSAILAVVGIGAHDGFTVGGVVGPMIAAFVAIAIGLGYRALYIESRERQRLIDELLETQRQLTSSEHDKGVLSERTRLAGEIHDTVAQGLSSIQMLLHAAERADPTGPGIEHIRLARGTAADNLAEARRFVRELTPPTLADSGLTAALRRLSSTHLQVAVSTHGTVRTLPMPIATALLRIAQGAIANVDKHAGTDIATISLVFVGEGVRMEVSDHGVGFDPATIQDEAAEDSFGFAVMRRRMRDLDGTLTVESAVGEGVRVIATIEQIA
ncbi:two-component sensor histidine kinase [Aeromicrobium sp. A1-2]|nr:two-component sensor histidine kinase [Aeromicrobium sp. A1-2]